MFIRFLEKAVIVLAVLFAVQGCAFYVEDDDGFSTHHHFHHGYWGDRHSSLPQNQAAEDGMSIQTSHLDGVRK